MGSSNVTLFARWVPPPASSAYNSNTVLLLPGDGDLLDKSVSAHTVGAQWGRDERRLRPVEVARWSSMVPMILSIQLADFEFGGGAWSIDTWMSNSTRSNHGLLGEHADAGNTGTIALRR